jgi:hypothetical protein
MTIDRAQVAVCVNMSVVLPNGYTGDWQSAIDQAFIFAKQKNITVNLTYAQQISFIIYPDMTDQEIELKKSSTFRIRM